MSETPTQLLERALAGRDVRSCRVLVADGFKDGDSVSYLAGNAFQIAHDERNAPVPMGRSGERRDLLVSITDEGPVRMLALAQVAPESGVLGIGVDLCSTEDFGEDEAGERFARLLFTDGEKALFDHLEGPVPTRRAMAFSAKEASFKATAAPLRRWYEGHDEELFFEAMDFELYPGGITRGTARKRHEDRAQHACERMGIDRIEVSFADYQGMVLCVAVALGQRGGGFVPLGS